MSPETTSFPERLRTRKRLLIGPANDAGQGNQWAQAAIRHLDDVAAQSFRFGIPENPYPVSYQVDWKVYRSDKDWAAAFAAFAMKRYTHVLIEGNKPILGWKKAGAGADIRKLRSAGVRVGMLAHGSDVRIPSVHAEREEWAAYGQMDPKLVQALEKSAGVANKEFARFDGPKFVSTLGLLDFIEGATWCPVIVEPQIWRSEREVLGTEIPVVAHIPSSTQKGSAWIDPILSDLDARGHLKYVRLSGIRRDEMPAHIGRCDIVIDQFGAADYGVAACEAMAAGRLVISRVADGVRDRIREQTGLELPIIEADPRTLESVVLAAIADRDGSRATAARGTEFIAAVHDGRESARALAELLDLPAASRLERFARRRRNSYRDSRAGASAKKSR